ncbi:MAG: hypothetical protein JRE47_04105, partial [Deltaproteobacteria bacterium]|nr:hypothetical protein [Deltaproteobacteria bacterium]
GKPFEHNWQDFRTHKVDEACEHFQQKQKRGEEMQNVKYVARQGTFHASSTAYVSLNA